MSFLWACVRLFCSSFGKVFVFFVREGVGGVIGWVLGAEWTLRMVMRGCSCCMEVGVRVYWGISSASNILLGVILCSSFRWFCFLYLE
jgi:hypothetical protein